MCVDLLLAGDLVALALLSSFLVNLLQLILLVVRSGHSIPTYSIKQDWRRTPPMNNHRLSERGPTKSKPRPAIPPTLQRGAARREISTIRGPATLGACSLSGFAAFFFFSHIVEGLGDLRGRELSGLLVKPLQETLLVCGAVSDAGAVVLSIRHVCTSTSTSTSREQAGHAYAAAA